MKRNLGVYLKFFFINCNFRFRICQLWMALLNIYYVRPNGLLLGLKVGSGSNSNTQKRNPPEKKFRRRERCYIIGLTQKNRKIRCTDQLSWQRKLWYKHVQNDWWCKWRYRKWKTKCKRPKQIWNPRIRSVWPTLDLDVTNLGFFQF